MNAPTSGRDLVSDRATAAPALADFILLNEEIAALVRARLPLESHLARIGAELPGRAGELAERIGKRMASGESLAAAMDVECASLPAAYRAVVIAGVESGQLASALESLVESASRLDQLRRVTGLAILYPLLILCVACLMLAVVISRVVPAFNWLKDSPYSLLAALSEWHYLVLVVAIGVPCAAALATAVWWWRSGSAAGATWSRHGSPSWLPFVGRVHRWNQAATFSELLLLLVERGLPLERALRLAGDANDDGRLRAAAHRFADQAESGGLKPLEIGSSLHGAALDFPMLIRLAFHHVDNRPLLAASLRQASTMYRERAVRAADWYAEYLPLLLTVGVGGALTIGFTFMVLWPYTSMLHEMANWNWR